MAVFTTDFLHVIAQQDELFKTKLTQKKTTPHVTLRDILFTDISKIRFQRVPFFFWVDACYKTLKRFSSEETEVKDFSWTKKMVSSLTRKRLKRAQLVPYAHDVNQAFSLHDSHQLSGLVRDVCKYCESFQNNWNSDTGAVSTLKSVAMDSASWVIRFLHAIGTLLTSDNSIAKFGLYALCVAPNIVWIVFHVTQTDGTYFSRGFEVIQNSVRRHSSIIQAAMGEFLASVEDGTTREKFSFLPNYIHTARNPWTVPIMRDICLTGIVLPTPATILMHSDWATTMATGLSISLLLMGMVDDNVEWENSGMAIDVRKGKVVVGKHCAAVDWRDLCGFHLWPFTTTTRVFESTPQFTVARKRHFLSTACYHYGCSDQIIKVLFDEKWWVYLPFLDTMHLYGEHSKLESKRHVSLPMSSSPDAPLFELFLDYTINIPHAILLDPRAFLTLLCIRRHKSCLLWLLTAAFLRKDTRHHAIILHPLLDSSLFEWTELCISPNGDRELREQVLFRTSEGGANEGAAILAETLGRLLPLAI